MSERVLVLPSPLLGVSAYEPLARAFSDNGCRAIVAPAHDGTPTDILASWAATAAQVEPSLLVAHSNAGLYAPLLPRREGSPVLFMDAALPPESGDFALAPPPLRSMLDALVDGDGRLPPWTRWWPCEQMRGLFPDDAWFESVDHDAPRRDLAYFDATLTAPGDWMARPAGYLAFGATYEVETQRARAAGWPVRVAAGHHLQHLVDPQRTCSRLLGLLDRLRSP